MPTGELQPERDEPSEDDLRRMLDARDAEKESARKRLSRKVGRVLAVFLVAVAGAILCFPASRRMIGVAPRENAEFAALKAALIQQSNPAASDVPDELKPFSVQPGQTSDHENLRFGMELLQFLRTGPE